MSYEIKVILNEVDEKVIRSIALDPQEWLENFVKNRISIAKQEIFNSEIQRLKDEGADSVPTNIEKTIESLEIKSAKDIHDEELQKLLNGPAGMS